MNQEQRNELKIKYRLFVGNKEDLILFKEALSNSRLPIDNKQMYLVVRNHNDSNYAEIGIMSEECYSLFINAFRYSSFFQKWAGKLAKIS